jgi:hypothetical protein
VIVVEEGAVERRMAARPGSVDVQAIGHFIQTARYRRGTISEYLDGKRVECGNLESVGCDRCRDGLAEWRATNTC